MSDITRYLDDIKKGNSHAASELLTVVYGELRRLAAQKMVSERPGHTLQATALVNEAFLRLGGADGFSFENRAHFFAAAAEAMRRILVESARRNRRLKRGGVQERVELSESSICAPVKDEKLLLVHDALDALAAEDPVKGEIVKLRFFVGLKHPEIASALGISESTVRRHWEVAKIRLHELMSGAPEERPGAGAGASPHLTGLPGAVG